MLELQEQELNYQKRLQNFQVPLSVDKSLTPAEAEAERAEDQADVDNGAMYGALLRTSADAFTAAEPLTEEEVAEKQKLSGTGFADWQKRDYQAFIRGAEKYGRDNFEYIALEVNKPAEDVKRYAEVFWTRYQEIDGKYASCFGDQSLMSLQTGKGKSARSPMPKRREPRINA